MAGGNKRRREALRQVNLLELAPERAAPWREDDGGRVVLERPRPPRGLRHLGEWISYHLSVRRLKLDEFGAFAWRRLDGNHTVAEIAAEMRRHFGERAEPAEERLGHYIRTLHREGLARYPGWDD